MSNDSFGGDKKVGKSILSAPEKKFINAAVGYVPDWLRSHHLTLLTIPISIVIIIGGFLAQGNVQWLWLVSLMIATQWLTDSLDGAAGRARNEGLVRWGYYMDHFLDYVFLGSILIAYGILLPSEFWFMQFFVLVIFGAFMINSYLAMAATNKFRIAYFGFGPTEARILFILINTMLIVFGKTYLAGALPYILAASFIVLCAVVYQTQKEVWAMDMAAKKK